jgi:ferredoxin-type protein NapG
MSKISRRQLFRLNLSELRKLCTLTRENLEEFVGLVRPPGAINEADFLTTCERCGNCAKACEFGSINKLGPSSGELESTPALELEKNPCRYCQDFPCIWACPSGALCGPTPSAPLATVEIHNENCLNSQGIICETCILHCPPSVKAIRMEGPFHARMPTIDQSLCVGCGLCAYHCEQGSEAIEVKKIRGGKGAEE